MSKKVASGTVVRMTVAEKEYLLKRIQEEHQTTLNGTSSKVNVATCQAEAALRAEVEDITEGLGIPALVEKAEKLIAGLNRESNKLYGRDILAIVAEGKSGGYEARAPREKNSQGETTIYGKQVEAARKRIQAPVEAAQERVEQVVKEANEVLRETRDQIMFSSNPDAMAGFLESYKQQAQKTRFAIEAATKTLPLLPGSVDAD